MFLVGGRGESEQLCCKGKNRARSQVEFGRGL